MVPTASVEYSLETIALCNMAPLNLINLNTALQLTFPNFVFVFTGA